MQAACERAPLQPNPKNEEMRTTLAMMNATKARLEEEVAAWEGLRGGQPKHDGKMPKVKLSASQEKVLAKAAGGGGASGIGMDDIQLQLEQLEAFVATTRAAIDLADADHAELSTALGNEAFEGYPGIGSPRALISSLAQ